MVHLGSVSVKISVPLLSSAFPLHRMHQQSTGDRRLQAPAALYIRLKVEFLLRKSTADTSLAPVAFIPIKLGAGTDDGLICRTQTPLTFAPQMI